MVRAVDGKIEIPGWSRASDIFFCFFVISSSAFAEGKKKLRICGRQKNSAFAEGKKTPHLRKTEVFGGAKKLRILCNICYINNR